jgi:O-antigen chain-terminating methyltransferase
VNAEELLKRVEEEIEREEEISSEAEREKKKSFTKEDFIHLHDEEFVKNAYRLILGREPDEEGMSYYLDHLRSGRRTKMQIVANIYASPEAKDRGVEIERIEIYKALSFIYKIPVVGYMTKWLIALFTLPRIVQRHNALDTALYAHTEGIRRTLLDGFRDGFDDMADEFRNRVDDLSDDIDRRLRLQSEDLEIRISDAMRELRRRMDGYTAQSDARLEDMEQLLRNISDMRLQYAETARRLMELIERERLRDGEEEAVSIISDTADERFYKALEDRFRGSEEEIEERVRGYLPEIRQVEGLTRVLDIGCGRGEWLRVLRKEGIEARGIEINRLFADSLVRQGLDVVCGDALEILPTIEDGSYSVVSGFHIVEHLPFSSLLSMLGHARRILHRGGVAIFETPNPKNLGVGACNFYTDPTHKNPIPPHLAKFLLEYSGFRDVRIVATESFDSIDLEDPALQPFVDEWVNQSQDYAVIGVAR